MPNTKFKRIVRDRMKQTGEKYTEARRHVLADGAAPSTEVNGPKAARADPSSPSTSAG